MGTIDAAKEFYLLLMVGYIPGAPNLPSQVVVEKIAVYYGIDRCKSASEEISGFDPVSVKFFCIKTDGFDKVIRN